MEDYSKKIKMKKKKSKVTGNHDEMPDFRMFDQTMKEAQMSPDFKPEKQRIDIVLIHQRDDKSDQASKEIRKCFEDKLRRRYNFVIKKETIGDLDYKLLHCPFRSLCEMAQFVNLEIPLDEVKTNEQEDNRAIRTPGTFTLCYCPCRPRKLHLDPHFQNNWADFNQTWYNDLVVDDDSSLYK